MIFGRHSVLKRGCSTWDPKQFPRAEFESRLDTVRKEMAHRDLDALVIYGDNYSFADLCYLTNYFPKVRGGIAVVPRDGALSLLLNIGSRDVPFAKTLTWVDDVRASNQVGSAGAELVKEKGFAKSRLGLVDSGEGFPLPQLEEMKRALPDVQWTNEDALFEPARLKKSPLELNAMRAAGHLLNAVCEDAQKVIKPGRKEYEIVADIDRLARDAGAEDIRILTGEKRLQPPSFKQSADVGNHWALYLAVQHERYWAEAGRTYVAPGDGKLRAAYEKAREVVARMAAELRPGNPVAAVDDIARRELGEFYATAAVYGLGNGIGLNQWEAPFLNDDDARRVSAPSAGATELTENTTVALRVVFETEGKLVMFGDSFVVTQNGPVSLTSKT
ncbi:MAG TPA: M24 family metallopeptidase [Verrucomicrobiae bacterium]|jgi:Xaa-Pro aminopeptidase|nr:M24 family metallopeptidase [Verrucomicrobiae bacterium]